MREIVSKATCSTHMVKDQAQAILMFLFQNDRGKKSSNLEVIKAQFMHKIHLEQHEDRQEKRWSHLNSNYSTHNKIFLTEKLQKNLTQREFKHCPK